MPKTSNLRRAFAERFVLTSGGATIVSASTLTVIANAFEKQIPMPILAILAFWIGAVTGYFVLIRNHNKKRNV